MITPAMMQKSSVLILFHDVSWGAISQALTFYSKAKVSYNHIANSNWTFRQTLPKFKNVSKKNLKTIYNVFNVTVFQSTKVHFMSKFG